MRLAIIAHPRHPIKSPFAGGLEAFTGSIIDYYSRIYDVTLYAHPDSEVPCELVSFNFDRESYKMYPDIVENNFILNCLQDIQSRNFDVIHNNSINPLPALWASKRSIPILTTLHTPPYAKLKASAGLASYAPNVHFTAVSHSLAEVWQPFINDIIPVTYNGIDLTQWRVHKRPRDFLFSYGRILPSKGFDLAISAARELRMPIKIAGPITDIEYFQTQVRSKLGPHDEYLGHLDHIAIRQVLKTAKSAVFGTRWDEPFGLSTLESIATGTPVAAFNRGAFAEILDAHSGVLATGNNVYSLAEAIEGSFSIKPCMAEARAREFPLAKMCSQYSRLLQDIT